MDEQTKAAMEQTGKTIAFNFGNTLKVKKGTKKDFKIGLRNNFANPNGNTVCYQLSLKCLQAMDESNTICAGAPIVGGSGVTSANKWFTRMITKTEMPNNEFGAYESTIQVTSAQPDTYIMEAELQYPEDLGNCQSGAQLKSAGTERFNIEVS